MARAEELNKIAERFEALEGSIEFDQLVHILNKTQATATYSKAYTITRIKNVDLPPEKHTFKGKVRR